MIYDAICHMFNTFMHAKAALNAVHTVLTDSNLVGIIDGFVGRRSFKISISTSTFGGCSGRVIVPFGDDEINKFTLCHRYPIRMIQQSIIDLMVEHGKPKSSVFAYHVLPIRPQLVGDGYEYIDVLRADCFWNAVSPDPYKTSEIVADCAKRVLRKQGYNLSFNSVTFRDTIRHCDAFIFARAYRIADCCKIN